MTTTAETITGVTDEQVAEMVRGNWFDTPDDDYPTWQRTINSYTEEDGEQVHQEMNQDVYPFVDFFHWCAETDDEFFMAETLEQALKWCDDKQDQFLPPDAVLDSEESHVSDATNQADRFAKHAAST